MRIRLAAALAASLLLAAGPATALDAEFVAPLTALAEGPLAALAAEPVLVEAIVAQNAVTAAYDQAEIDRLDAQWRAEADAARRPLIDAVLANAASRRLAEIAEASAGQYAEIIATDARGLNVAQSAITSDYWQATRTSSPRPSPGRGRRVLGEVERTNPPRPSRARSASPSSIRPPAPPSARSPWASISPRYEPFSRIFAMTPRLQLTPTILLPVARRCSSSSGCHVPLGASAIGTLERTLAAGRPR